MRHSLTIIVSLIVLAAITLSACGEKKPSPAEQTQAALADTISQWHSDFAASTSALTAAADQFCSSPNANRWLALQQRWKEAMLDWQAVGIINFGPVLDGNQAWKIQFWPDKHNLVAKKIRAILAEDTSIDVARIEKASVVIQGLSGLEYLLFDPSVQPIDYEREPRRCDLLKAVAGHTMGVARQIDSHWHATTGDYFTLFAHPAADNPAYKDFNAALTAVIDAILADIENVRWKKLAGPAGMETQGDKTLFKPRPYLAEAWRSQSSLALAKANIDAVDQLLTALRPYLDSHPNGAPLGQSIHSHIKTIQQQLDSIDISLIQAITHPPDQDKLAKIDKQLADLLAQLKRPLPTALGITLGFNANDGD